MLPVMKDQKVKKKLSKTLTYHKFAKWFWDQIIFYMYRSDSIKLTGLIVCYQYGKRLKCEMYKIRAFFSKATKTGLRNFGSCVMNLRRKSPNFRWTYRIVYWTDSKNFGCFEKGKFIFEDAAISSSNRTKLKNPCTTLASVQNRSASVQN